MNIIPFQNNQLNTRNADLVNRLFNPKLTGEDVLKEMINTSYQLKKKLKQNPQQLTKFYCGEEFQQLVHNQIKQNSFLHEQSKHKLQEPITAYTSPGVIVDKLSVSYMDKYLTFDDSQIYKQLEMDSKLIQSLAKISCKLEQSSQIYNPSSNFHNLKSIIQGKQNLTRVFNEVVEILQPHSIVSSVNTGHGLNEEIFDLNGNLFSITLDENNINPEKRNKIGKYYWEQFELLFSWTINLADHTHKNPLLAHTFLENSQFIKDIFHQNKLK